MTGQSISDDILSHIHKITNSECLLFASTTDGGSNMLSASRTISGVDNVRCFLHVCHLIITDFFDLPICSEYITSLREHIKSIRNTTSRRETVSRKCEAQGIRKEVFILDVPTRWNSTFLMIEQFLTLGSVLDTLHFHDLSFRTLSRPAGPLEFYQS